ncbi:MAG TPA: hypothetical protein PKD37_01890 [Oligoflexia bacterium]|nr:hypothetical protein [Oligoflexia bacterium]HMP26729.1 hypothetical protein [Oligoflexia bacterium]
MKLRSRNKRKTRSEQFDPKKEALINLLSEKIAERGLIVRREELKQGIGWKVKSGSCRLDEQAVLFIDRKLPQIDQISLLKEKCLELKIDCPTTDV